MAASAEEAALQALQAEAARCCRRASRSASCVRALELRGALRASAIVQGGGRSMEAERAKLRKLVDEARDEAAAGGSWRRRAAKRPLSCAPRRKERDAGASPSSSTLNLSKEQLALRERD